MQRIPVDPSKIVSVGVMVPHGTPEPREGRIPWVAELYRILNPSVSDSWQGGGQQIAVSYDVCPSCHIFAEYLQRELIKELNAPAARAAHAIVQFRGLLDPDVPSAPSRDIAVITLVEKAPIYNHNILLFKSAELVAAAISRRKPWWKFWKT